MGCLGEDWAKGHANKRTLLSQIEVMQRNYNMKITIINTSLGLP